ncbi:hypothetical protein Dimus_027583 [Dionaea muscipula]
MKSLKLKFLGFELPGSSGSGPTLLIMPESPVHSSAKPINPLDSGSPLPSSSPQIAGGEVGLEQVPNVDGDGDDSH